MIGKSSGNGLAGKENSFVPTRMMSKYVHSQETKIIANMYAL